MANTVTSRKKLRIGILNDSVYSSKYVYELIEWGQSEPNLDISHLILHPSTRQGDKAHPHTKVGKLFKSLSRKGVLATFSIVLFRLLCLVETIYLKRFERYRDHLATFDLGSLLKERITVLPEVSQSGFVYLFSEDDVRRIEALDFDLLIRCGRGILRGTILKASRLGIISFHHGDNRINRGGPAGFWEVYLRQDTTGFTIQRLTEELDGGDVLMRGHLPTQEYYLLNQAKLFEKSNYYLKQLILRIASSGDLPNTLPSLPYSEKLYRIPKARESAIYLSRNFALKFRNKVHRLLGIDYRWQVAFLRSNWRQTVLWRGIKLENPPFHFLADPFVWRKNGKDFCFLEDYDYRTRLGAIAVYELGMSGAARLGIALKEDFHLSFPYLFEFEGELFMCPESFQNNDIRIYRCVEFPLRWELKKIVMQNVSAADSMIVQRGGKWWMFTNIDPVVGGDHCTELSIFSADSPFADNWKPHPLNPIVVDASRARNAGLIVEGARLYRISQGQGFEIYGRNSLINEVIELTDTTYAENCISKITPTFQDGILGSHHLHSNGAVTVFDFVRRSRIKN